MFWLHMIYFCLYHMYMIGDGSAAGHLGGSNPNEPWHITTRYYDKQGDQIPGQKGDAWHVY